MTKTILDTIVDDAAQGLLSRKRDRLVSSLEDMPGFERETYSLADSLRNADVSVIAELKRRSPSKGILREQFDPQEIARSYASAGARALSVLTEENYFEGNLGHLEDVRSAVKLPVLRKDFITDPYQLIEARAFGADAVLLIATLLEKSHLRDLLAAATELDLDCLIELYDERELDRVELEFVSILGVNNRNLHTFEVDINRAPRILARVPDRIVRVAESGLSTGEDLAEMQTAAIDAVLIGEALITNPDPGAELSRIREDCQRIMSGTRTTREGYTTP